MALTLDQVKTIYLNVLNRPATDAEAQSWVNVNTAGALTDQQVRDAIINSNEATNFVDPIVRLYQAAFGRVPDKVGFDANVDGFARGGLSLQQLGNIFATSTEFTGRYGTSVTEAYVQALYSNVLGRLGQPAEVSAWVNSGQSMAQILLGFSQSQEFIGRSAGPIDTFLNAAAQGTATYQGSLISGGASSTLALTDKVDVITGTTGADTISGILATTGATFTAADTIDGGAGTDTLNITADALAAGFAIPPATINNVENFFIRNLSGQTFTQNFGTIAGEEQVWNDRSVDTFSVNSLANGTTAGIKGNGSTVLGASTFTHVAAATAATLIIDGGAAAGNASDVTVDGAGLTAVTINSTGAANTIDGLALGTAVKAVTVNATTDLTIGAGNAAGITGVGASTVITVAGAGKVNLDTLTANVSEVNASTNTGGVTVVLGEAGDKFTGGSGNDSVTLAAGPTADVAGGAGTGDRITVTDDTFVDTAAEQGKLSGFEIFRVAEAGAFAETDISKFAGITAIEFNGTTSANIKGIADQTLTAIGDNVGGLTLTKSSALAGGNDLLTLTLDNSVGKHGDGVDAGQVVAANIDNLTFNSIGKNLNASESNSVGAINGNGDLNQVTITGDTDFSLTTGASATDTISATGFSGALTVNATDSTVATNIAGGTGKNSLTGSANADVITGNAADDTLVGLAGNDTISGGAGVDKITGGVGADTLTGGAGKDVFFYTGADAANATTANTDKITDFVTADDVIRLDTDADQFLTGLTLTATTTVNFNTAQTIATAADLTAVYTGITAIGASVNATLQAVVVTVSAGAAAGTYLYINDNTAGKDAAEDFLVNITGITGTLAASNFTFGADA